MLKNKRAKGTQFEHRVRDYFREGGFFVVRQASSAFPDLIVFKKVKYSLGTNAMFVECKVNGNLSKEEIEKLIKLREEFSVRIFKAYPKGSAYDKRKENIVLEEIL